MAAKPAKITGASVYLEGQFITAIQSISLPDIKFGEIEHNVLGLGGTIKDYNVFDVQVMEGTISVSAPSAVLKRVMNPTKTFVIEARVNYSGHDASQGGVTNDGESITMEVVFGGTNLGDRQNNEGGEQEFAYSCHSVICKQNGEELYYINPVTNSVRVGEEDLTAEIKLNL
jgi:phage tail tube protein FII